MNTIRKRKLLTVSFFVFLLAMVALLVLYALRQNINLFYTPSQIVLGKAPGNHSIRIGGMVVPGSVIRSSHKLWVHFKITDYQQEVNVSYHGVLPTLFREGQGVVAQGELKDNKHFEAQEVLAKHDENYMPKEVKQALAEANLLSKKARL